MIPNVGLNAVAGRPKEEYGVEPTAFDEMRPGCYDVDERIKDMNAGGVLGSMNFPSFPGFAGRLFASRADKDLALAVARRPTTTGTSTSGAARTPAASSRWRCRCSGTPSSPRQRSAGSPRRAALVDFTREPGGARLPELPRRVLGPVLEGAERHRHGVSVHLGSSGQLVRHRARRAGRRDDHAAADEHLPGGRRHPVVARHQEVPRRSSSRCPRAAPAGSRTSSTVSTAPTTCTTRGPVRTSASKLPSEVFREHFLTCFIDDPVGIQLRHVIGIDNIAWECDYPHSDSSWPTAPEDLGERRGRRPRRRARQDHARERDALVLVRPVRPPPKEQAPWRRCAPRSAGHDV